MIGKYKDTIFFILLVALAILSHTAWFDFGNILTHGDWKFRFDEHVRELFTAWQSWGGFLDFGSANVLLSGYPFRGVLWPAIVSLGLSYDTAVKLTLLIPISLLGFVTPFLLARKLTNDSLIAFVVALFYGSTTYFLIVQTAHLPIALIYAACPLYILLFRRVLDANHTRDWIWLVLTFSVGVSYDVRMMFIVALIMFVYFIAHIIFDRDVKRFTKNIVISFFLGLLLNSYWIDPYLMTSISADISQVAGRGVFGNDLFSMFHAFTVMKWNWTGASPDFSFTLLRVPAYLFVFPFLAMGVLLLKKKQEEGRDMTFFLILAILGLLLTKQSEEPFTYLYDWVYSHIPGFNLFREASKFYVMTALSYVGLIGFSLLFLKQSTKPFSRYIFFGSMVALTMVSVINLRPLVTRDMDTLHVSREIPNDYLLLRDYLSGKSDYFRTLWIPTDSRWTYYTNNHPAVDADSLVYSVKDVMQKTVTSQNLFRFPFIDAVLDRSAIRYVIVPIQDTHNDDDFFESYYGNRGKYIDALNDTPFLEKIDMETDELVVYENAGYRPHIYVTSAEETISESLPYTTVEYESISPSEYKVSLRDVSSPVWLTFSEAYHPEWNIRVGEFSWFRSIFESNYFIPKESHRSTDVRLNAFHIDPDILCEAYSCYRRADGTYDMELVLFFRPQSYFLLGLLMSVVTLVGCVIYLLLSRFRGFVSKTDANRSR